MQEEEEAVFPQENVQSADPSMPMDTQGVEAQGEPPRIPMDFGGMDARYFRTEYLKSMALATTNIQLMNDWCPSQLKRLENTCQQIENKGGDPQVIDLIHEDLHKSFIQMVKAEGHYPEMSEATSSTMYNM